MDVRRLRLLLELSRLGSMHEVAAELGTTTSAVSQGIAALAREVGTPLVEPDGRRVRLTPAGTASPSTRSPSSRRSRPRGSTSTRPPSRPGWCASPDSRPRSAGRCCRPWTTSAHTHPDIEVRVHEYEPHEAVDLLARDDIDLGADRTTTNARRWSLAQRPRGRRALERCRLGHRRGASRVRRAARPFDVVRRPRLDRRTSRNTADEEVVRTRRVDGRRSRPVSATIRIDALELVDDLDRRRARHRVLLRPRACLAHAACRVRAR